MNDLEALNGGRFEVHKNMDGLDVVSWDLYCLKREEVDDEQERQRIGCKMMHMLTGKEEYNRKMWSLGAQKVNQQKQEDAERRKQGLKTKGSKNPRKGLFKRPDKSDAQRKREARERKKREQEMLLEAGTAGVQETGD
jgi:hypothetical protein